MTRKLRVTRGDLQRFAEASGDRNPLHLDDAFSRQTPYGRPIAQGALVAIAALGAADATALRFAKSIDIQFKQPVFPGEEYTIFVADSGGDTTRIQVTGGGRVAVTIAVTSDLEGAPIPAPPKQERAEHPAEPRRHSLEELARPAVVFREPYACRLDLLSALAADLDADSVPEAVPMWLAAASYAVGMVVPGEDAVFVGARITRSSSAESGVLTASVSAADDRTGLVVVDATVEQAAASASMTLQTFLRPRVPASDRVSIGRYLAPSNELAGRNVLVVGGSRGLGAALSGAFATQGATVWVGFARSRERAETLRSEFGAEAIRLLQFDAEDVEQTQQAFATFRTHEDALDGIVLCAAPPLNEATLHPEATTAALRYVASSVAMNWSPLAEGLQVLSPHGWVVVLSSSSLEDPPETWPHYVAAKGALEGLAAFCARQTPARVTAVRAPKMWTDSMNTPMGRLGAVPTEQVAAAIARWAMSDEPSSGPLVLTPGDLRERAPELREP